MGFKPKSLKAAIKKIETISKASTAEANIPLTISVQNFNKETIALIDVEQNIVIDPVESEDFYTAPPQYFKVIDGENISYNSIKINNTTFDLNSLSSSEIQSLLSYLNVKTLGEGTSIFEGKNYQGDTLLFKSIVGTHGTVVTSDENSIYIDSSSSSNSQPFVFTQSIPSSTWIIAHYLNAFPSITVVDSSNRVVEGDENYDSPNQITLNFVGAFSGYAYLSL